VAGGNGLSSNYDDTWEWDGIDWVRQPDMPQALTPLEMTFSTEEGTLVAVGDGVALRRTGDTWTALPAPPGGAPTGLVYDDATTLVVATGRDLDQTYFWNGSSWLPGGLSSELPSLDHAAMSFDGSRGRVLLFGGVDDSGPVSSTWELGDLHWIDLATFDHPPALRSHRMAYHAARRKVVLYGGLTGHSEFYALLARPWILRYESGEQEEVCTTGYDVDGDALIGCDDPDCWGYCSPHCPPAAQSCNASLPYCGDGECTPIESYRICPQDCAPAPVCGDYFCDPGEDSSSCPGDC